MYIFLEWGEIFSYIVISLFCQWKQSLHPQWSQPLHPQGAPPPPSEGINPALPEETVMASPEVVAMKDNARFAQHHPPPSFFASRLVTRLRSQQVPKDEVQNVRK